ncbi:oxidoreductase [Arenicella chitinivorans]|uniref:Oxidoreductase n=1 Tax=Arenicella chitinivorans TaxID=1329800 RepID=A0A918RS60_9GAMM|nr:aldo/keto reductase [Arenicella chitinivorans]GHA06758.1 oxidoreductase [Arenicella chitinivorans]
MQKVHVVPDGPAFSELVQGYWRMGEWDRSLQSHLRFLEQHLELGITTVDHAHVYGGDPSCEALFGDVLKLQPSLRSKLEIVSKCGIELVDHQDVRVNHYDASPNAIRASVETSLRRLGTDYLDVLLLHRPDLLLDADAVADTFNELHQEGKVQHFGVSNFTNTQFALLQSRLEKPLVTNQVEINPVNLNTVNDGTLEFLQQHRVRPMAWSCLAGGHIFGDQSTQMTRLRHTLEDIANELSVDAIDQVVYAWVRRLPSKPVVIIGSGDITRVQRAVDALNLSLSQEQWYRIWVASMGHGVP